MAKSLEDYTDREIEEAIEHRLLKASDPQGTMSYQVAELQKVQLWQMEQQRRLLDRIARAVEQLK